MRVLLTVIVSSNAALSFVNFVRTVTFTSSNEYYLSHKSTFLVLRDLDKNVEEEHIMET